ncbi:MAG: DUF2200 domain-containing protein [Coriobacteriales bacterium]|nr:DUF2200 domain-containing protein [Coriobacteriales bacterium]
MPCMNVFDMSFAKLYQALVAKAERKGRARSEVDEVTGWLLGYAPEDLAKLADSEVTYGSFLSDAPFVNPNADLIKGTICGVRVETIEDPLTKRMRQLDKLVDELAKGRPMEKILRT